MIEIQNLTVRFGDHVALADVNLSIQRGEFVLLTGASGCGKTTLARCLNGVVPQIVPASLEGRIIVDGREIAATGVAESAQSVGMVFQNPATQLFNLTVGEEVAFGPRNLGLDAAEVARRVDGALTAVGLAGMGNRSIRALSGGEQQRLAIAAVLAMGPRVLVLDEPTSSLDVKSTQEIMQTLARLNDEGVTILVTEHRLGEVVRLARRTILMDGGRIVADGPTTAVFGQRELLRRLGLRVPGHEPQGDWATLLAPNGHHSGTPVVELREIEAGYGNTSVLRGVNLALYPGEFAALVGDNGAGKSTLARVLAGLVKPRRGKIDFGQQHPVSLGRDIGMVFQNPIHQLFCDTVEDEVRFGPRNFGLTDENTIQSTLLATDLIALRRRGTHELSVGQQQRVALAAVLSLRPRLVILDEPTLGQDWRHLSLFMDLLVQLNAIGSTIFLITHDYKVVHRYARRILLLRDGRIVADGVPIIKS